jgi:site-specific DNA recombinase
MQVALYGRVSTERQEREQTIESQIAVVQAWIQEQGHILEARHIFTDAGYSGSRLDRPGLDRLRDAAREGEFDAIAVLSPDRLARKYAYQVLLLEEFKRAGCAVIFVRRPISDDPNDQLLLQIQGAIAEYERAVLGERFRRGKLQKARSGFYLAGKAPYGYAYVPKREGVPGYLIVDDAEADLVRMLYRWLVDERMTIRQIIKRLNGGPWYPRSGKHPWSSSVVHHILADPIYGGTAYANRYRYVPPKKPRATRSPRAGEATCRQPKPKEEWIPIPVPALIDQTTCDQAQAQLARNSVLSFRHNTKYSYLLRCLLTCNTCGLAMFGRLEKATATHAERRYYLCHGKDCILSAREQICPQRPVKADELEAAVWNHVVALLADPAQLLRQFQQFSHAAIDGDGAEQTEEQRLNTRIERLGREEKRLVDAYQTEVITLGELAQRREELARRRAALVEQQGQQARLRQERARAQEVLVDLTAFCERLRSRLAEVTFEEKQAILQLLIERVIVRADTLEIHHVIPLSNPLPGPAPPDDPPIVQLRSDGVKHTALVLHPRTQIDPLQGGREPGAAITDDQPEPVLRRHPPLTQSLDQALPVLLVFLLRALPIQHPPLPGRGVHPVGDQQPHLRAPDPNPLPPRGVDKRLRGRLKDPHPETIQEDDGGNPRQRARMEGARHPQYVEDPGVDRTLGEGAAIGRCVQRTNLPQRQTQGDRLAQPFLHLGTEPIVRGKHREAQIDGAATMTAHPRDPHVNDDPGDRQRPRIRAVAPKPTPPRALTRVATRPHLDRVGPIPPRPDWTPQELGHLRLHQRSDEHLDQADPVLNPRLLA